MREKTVQPPSPTTLSNWGRHRGGHLGLSRGQGWDPEEMNFPGCTGWEGGGARRTCSGGMIPMAPSAEGQEEQRMVPGGRCWDTGSSGLDQAVTGEMIPRQEQIAVNPHLLLSRHICRACLELSVMFLHTGFDTLECFYQMEVGPERIHHQDGSFILTHVSINGVQFPQGEMEPLSLWNMVILCLNMKLKILASAAPGSSFPSQAQGTNCPLSSEEIISLLYFLSPFQDGW
ncbi:uncharacterized protein [Symphalangus syndactylus]|uniref:uncharacterized protein isoform X2 n=1 Tax=Symphalangus syndactylus TaxID=9590 RepID=UPI0030060393